MGKRRPAARDGKVLREVPRDLMGGPYAVSKHLRRLVVARMKEGTSLNKLAEECGVSQPSLWRFVYATHETQAVTIDRLAVYFGMELRAR